MTIIIDDNDDDDDDDNYNHLKHTKNSFNQLTYRYVVVGGGKRGNN